jgi:intron-binding protein aquarius
MPRIVTTVDKYQGEQNDYVILSLTRTLRPGYLRDVRRVTVALSRARLGLYILGRKSVFESCYELKDAFEELFQREDKLMLVQGEMWPKTSRMVDDDVPATSFQGVEHLGQYVYEMTQAKIKMMKEKNIILPPVEEQVGEGVDDEDDVIQDGPSEPESDEGLE